MGGNKLDPNQIGYYLAGLLEGDGHISIPALDKTTLTSPGGLSISPRVSQPWETRSEGPGPPSVRVD
jgi:hypothetical protein